MPKTGRPKGTVNRGTGFQIRLNPEVYKKAKLVVSQSNAKLSDYISDLVSPAVDRDYARTLNELKGGA